MASGLDAHLRASTNDCKRIDSISVRAKTIHRFGKKAEKKSEDGKLKYDDPINQIQDQIGARIVVRYLEDVDRVSKAVERYYRPIERRLVVPDSEDAFGYEGKHYVFFIPTAALPTDAERNFPKFFELQIKTLFQHAWSEAEHDLRYKAGKKPLTPEERRKVFFTAAQAWGADQIFQELFSGQD